MLKKQIENYKKKISQLKAILQVEVNKCACRGETRDENLIKEKRIEIKKIEKLISQLERI